MFFKTTFATFFLNFSLIFLLIFLVVPSQAGVRCPKDQIQVSVRCNAFSGTLAFESHVGTYYLEKEIFDSGTGVLGCRYQAHEWLSKYMLKQNLDSTSNTTISEQNIRMINSIEGLNHLLADVHHIEADQDVDNFFELRNPSTCLKYTISSKGNVTPVLNGQFINLGLDVLFQDQSPEVNTQTSYNKSTRIVLNQKLMDEEGNFAAGTYETGSKCTVSIQ